MLDRNPYSSGGSDYGSDLKTLARAKHDGLDLDLIPELARSALQALEPVERGALVDRLTMLGMSMANGKDADQVKAWLHETARLLSDLPQGALFAGIDECVKEPGRVFVPSVGEIREKVAPILAKEEYAAARLNALAKMIEEGAELPEYLPPPQWPPAAEPEPEKEYCDPAEAARILAQFGFRSSFAEPKTRAQMVAEGQVPPPIKSEPSDPWSMMS